jgi:hypothetical protein
MSSYKLEETLEAVKYRILTERHFLTQEAVVRQRIVDPILEALGWNASELDLVREQKVEEVKNCDFRISEKPEDHIIIQEKEKKEKDTSGSPGKSPVLDYVLFEKLPWARLPRVYIEVKAMSNSVTNQFINPLRNLAKQKRDDLWIKRDLFSKESENWNNHISSLRSLLEQKPPCNGILCIELSILLWPSIIVLTNGETWFIFYFRFRKDGEVKDGEVEEWDFKLKHVFSFTSNTLYEIGYALNTTVSRQAIRGINDVPVEIGGQKYYSVRASLGEFSSSKRGRASSVEAIIWPSLSSLSSFSSDYLSPATIYSVKGPWKEITKQLPDKIRNIFPILPPTKLGGDGVTGMSAINILYDYLFKIWSYYPQIGINPDSVLLNFYL